jgi:hypothetical protein
MPCIYVRNSFGRALFLLLCACSGGLQFACQEQAPKETETDKDVQTQLAEATLPAAAAGRQPVPLDEQDDPAAPACLPRSDVVAGWIKTRPARVTPAGQYIRSLDDSLRAAKLRRYRIVEATYCLYEKIIGGARFSLEMEMLRCESPDDAFGLYSTQRQGGPVGHTGRAWACKTGDSYRLYAWQADYMVRAEVRPASDYRIMADAERLLARLLLALPEVEPPKLVRYLPASGGNLEARWFARSCASLVGPLAEVVPAEKTGVLDEVLGMDRAAGIAVAAYDADQEDPPDYIWLVEYGSAADAEQAYQRYRSAAEQAASEKGAASGPPATLLMSPVGRFLAGSWSPEQESVMHLLPVCRTTIKKAISSSGRS